MKRAAAAAVVSLLSIAPALWIVSLSLRAPRETTSVWFRPTLDNYRTVLGGRSRTAGISTPEGATFGGDLGRSALVALVSTLLALGVGAPAAHALARARRAPRRILLFILSTRMAPPIAVLIPFYVLFYDLSLLDTVWGLVTVYFPLNLSLVIWLLRGYVLEVPVDLEEAAQTEGASRWGAVWRVTLPLCAPGLAATAVFALLASWSEFLLATMLTTSAARTAPVGLWAFVTFRQVVWGKLAAAGVLVALPIVIVVLVAQRHLVRGLTAGAVRG